MYAEQSYFKLRKVCVCDAVIGKENGKMKHVQRKISPCINCTHVLDPENCDNKRCTAWRRWFVERWDSIRSIPREQVDQAKPQYVGVALGGNVYAAPQQIDAYLKKDPCSGCRLAGKLCMQPCRTKRVWKRIKEELNR